MKPITRLLILFNVLFWFGLLGFSQLGCSRSGDNGVTPIVQESAGPNFLQEITDKVGLKFIQDAGPQNRSFFLPQICGSGGAVFDCDGDGLMDIYLVQNAGPDSPSKNQLFKQMKDGTFKDISAGSGLDVTGFCTGVAIGDVNNDGKPDVLVTSYPAKGKDGKRQTSTIRLFLNLGDGKFKDITEEAGLNNDPYWTTSAGFFDFNRDGYLDLFVASYVDFDEDRRCDEAGGKRDYCSPKNFPGTPSKLYRNAGAKAKEMGKAVFFEDVSEATNIHRKGGPGFGIVISDFNGDGHPDILVANDGTDNYLWIFNPKTGTYEDEARRRGVHRNNLGQQCANMGVAWGDITNTGLNALFITHLPDENHTLWCQVRPGYFQDKTAFHQLATTKWRGAGWGVTLQDFDNDGWLDMALVNGRVASRGNFRGESWDDFRANFGDNNQVFLNDGTGKFIDISTGSKDFSEKQNVARALMWGDFSNSGAMDLVVTEINGPARVFRNVAEKRGNWLMIRCIEPALGGRDAYGAVLTIKAGGNKWLREINPSLSYLTSSDPRVHVGVGKVNKVDGIDVVWADGVRESFPSMNVNQQVVLKRGEGKTAKTSEK